MSGLLLLVTTLGLGIPALTAAHRLVACSHPLRLAVAVMLFVAGSLATLIGLGLLGQLTPPAVLAVSLAVALLTLPWTRTLVRGWLGWRPTFNGPPLTPWSLLTGTLLAGTLSLYVAKTLIAGTRFGPDDLSYHASVVAHWVVDRGLTLAPFNYHAYYPFNAETLALWFVLPVGHDGFANLSGLVWTALLALSTWTLARSIGASRSAAAAGVTLLLASDVLFGATQTFSASDVAGPAAGIAALAILAPAGRASARVRALVAGLAAGTALGVKLTVAPLLAPVPIWMWIRERRPAPVLLVLAAIPLAGGFWYLRNLLTAGNPLFPADLGPLSGPFDGAAQAETKLITGLLGGELTPAHLAQAVDWPWPLAILSALGYVRSLADRRPGVGFARFLAATGILALVAVPFLPFSGTDNSPHASLRIEPRFLIPTFALGTVLMTPWLDGRRWRQVLLRTVSASAAVAALVHLPFPSAVLAAAGGAAFLGLVRWPRLRPLAGGAAAALGVAALVLPLKRQQTTEEILAHDGGIMRGVWAEVDAIPAGARIAWFGPTAYRYYPLFGRRYQHHPLWVDPAGRPVPPLHQRARDIDSWWDRHPRGEGDLVTNLLTAGVDVVLVTQWSGDRWPPQYASLDQSPHAERRFDDGTSSLWILTDPAGTGVREGP